MSTLTGTVTSVAREKTVTVQVVRRWMHPLYKKYINLSKKYACHVEDIKLEEGDTVEIESCRPLSKTKHFKVTKKLSK